LAGQRAFANMRTMLAHAALSLFVVVRLYDIHGVSNDTLATARDTAARIMRDADINLRWADCPCSQAVGSAELMIRVASAGQGAEPKSLGFSYVDVNQRAGTLATVFAERVRALAAIAHADEGELLGRAMAHEIAHLLFGTHEHAHAGLMRGTWTSIELGRNQPTDWMLSRDEAVRLRAALLRRIRGVQTPVVVATGEAIEPLNAP
jgi:hypothetical protein